jgi:hypothetical protein
MQQRTKLLFLLHKKWGPYAAFHKKWGPYAAFHKKWGPSAAFHGMANTCHIECSMMTHLAMFQNSKYHFHVKMLNSAIAGSRGVCGNLHFPVPSMNSLNQTEPVSFSILSFWAFFRDFVVLYLNSFVNKEVHENNILYTVSHAKQSK